MKPLNQKEISRARWKFIGWFIPILLLMALGSFTYRVTEQQHFVQLKEKENQYTEIFSEQAKLAGQVDSLILYITKLKDEDRLISRFRQLQGIVTDMRVTIDKKRKSTDSLHYEIYTGLMKDVNLIQSSLDSIKIVSDEHVRNKELLEACIEKYEAQLKKSK